MRFGYGVTEKVLRDLVEAVLTVRAPEKLELLRGSLGHGLSTEQRESVRELLSDELVESGLGPDDEPNDRGRLLEAAIDWLGRL